MNIDAVEGSEEDSYRFNPWRAPGHAPVVDACGMAGGKLKTQKIGGVSCSVLQSAAKCCANIKLVFKLIFVVIV